MVGGLGRWLDDSRQARNMSDAEGESDPGVLFSSGLIAGASVTGTILAMLQLSEPTREFLRKINVTGTLGWFASSDLVAFLLFLGLAAILYLVAHETLLKGAPDGERPSA